MQNFLNHQSETKTGFNELALSLDTLRALRKPMDSLVFTKIQHDYAGTLNGLASVAELSEALRASTLKDSYGQFFGNSSSSSISSWDATHGNSPFESIFNASKNYEDAANFLNLGGYRSELEKISSRLEQINKITPPFGGNNISLLNRTSEIASTYISSATSLYVTEFKLDFFKNQTSLLGDKSSIKAFPGVLTASIDKLHDSLSRMSQEGATAWLNISSSPSVFANTSFELLNLPATELYTSSNLVSAISFFESKAFDESGSLDSVVRYASETIEARLLAFDKDLLEAYLGGISAIEQGGFDWQRHSMTSFRELLTHILHRLSPDSEVIASGGELHEGRPTRRARLKFLFSGVAGGQFDKFYEADLTAAIHLFELLNGDTHRLGSKATPAQLFYLKGRIAGLILSMLAAKGF
ncbi:hypothetical protein [Polynucleobacter sp. P1-05-14]|uniref:pPIWI-associating nuclease domain-containing protein n=1 Tax=Polynucleobacter sp. P1-05-14 TaxID=1819732 RepID=UPI001C0D806A|nr:hypothetical protein [Polynucleobacter sp. P1-05-14]MBU3548114.1 hypothetical protein [Polynucleobacter sp. P1-05-14]